MRLNPTLYPLVAVLLAASWGCGKSAAPVVECVSACAAWEGCTSGSCQPLAGRCSASATCPTDKPWCDPTAHACGEDPRCAACQPWQSCSAGECRPASGKCAVDGDCTAGVCDTAAHSCVDSFCSPACAEWQTCTLHACTMTPGRCESNGDCGNRDTPECKVATRTCGAPDLATPVTPTWRGLVVTTNALKPYFEKLALLHTLTGVPTRVVSTEEICAGKCNDLNLRGDTPKAIKEYVARQQGLETMVIGGDIEDVPSRKIHDRFSNAIYGVNFDEDFYTDFYYADFSQWDSDGDGVYAQDGVDHPAYVPNIAVTRIPASSQWQVDSYVAKVLAHLTAYDLTRIQTSLFLSNVAAKVTVPLTSMQVPIDSAIYFEMSNRTLSLMSPQFSRTKLYSSLPMQDATTLTVAAETTELQRSYNLVVHAGHGYVDGLTVEIDGANDFTGTAAWNLTNAQFPIFLSGACSAGTFAASDSAGEKLVLAPNGGAIGYLGNGATGLGLAGGAQFVDEFLRYTFATPHPLVGGAFLAAHKNLPKTDTIAIPVPYVGSINVNTVDQDSYEWTQKSVTFLGDGLIPIYTDATMVAAPTVTVERQAFGTFSRLVFHFSPVSAGTLEVKAGDQLYELPVNGTEASMMLRRAPVGLSYGFHAPLTLSAYRDTTF